MKNKPSNKTCFNCKGTKKEPHSFTPTTCQTCGGTGKLDGWHKTK